MEKKEITYCILTKVQELIDESGIKIPDSTIDGVNMIGKKKGKSQAVIVCFTTHRHRTLFYKAKKKIKRGPKIHIDLKKKRLNILKESFI